MSRLLSRQIAIVVITLLAVTGCKPKPTMPVTGSAAPKIVESGPPVSEKEAEEYGRKVEKAFTNKDANALANLLQIEDLCLRSLSDFNMTDEERRGVMDGFSKYGGGERMCRTLLAQTEGAEVKMLRSRMKNGQLSVLLRVYGEENGLNYLELLLARSGSQVTTEDVYMFIVGETFSQLIRRLFLVALPLKGGGPQFKLYQDNMATIRRMQECLRNGDQAEARRIYFSLPTALREEKSIHIQGLRACQGDDATYLGEMERYRKLHPNDPSLDLVMVDYHFLKKDAKQLRECLWRLDEAVGGDAALRVFDAKFHFEQGDHAEARRLATEAIKVEDTLIGAYWVLADVAIAKNDHAETARILKAVVVQCHFQLDVEGLKTTEAYERFVKSKEYTALCEWMANRAR